MRVTIASRIFSPEPAAASFRLAALADALDAAGHAVTVLTTAAPGGKANVVTGVTVRRAPVLRDASGYVRGYLQYMSFDIPLLFRLLFSRKADVFVVEPPPTTGFVVRCVSAIRRTPYVYYAADVWSDAARSTGASRWIVSIVRWLEAKSFRGAWRVIAVSDGVADRVRVLASHDRVDIVPNGINTSIFNPSGPSGEDGPVAVYAGTTSEWQGADIFIRAMPHVLELVPNARLHFIGQGSAWESLRELASSVAPKEIEFTDVLPPEDAAVFLRSARAGLVSLKPGQGYDFAIPTKIYASLACGTPVIFAGGGPAAALIDRGNLGAACSWSVEKVTEAMVAMLSKEPSSSERNRVAEWAVANVSQSVSARRVADIVETTR